MAQNITIAGNQYPSVPSIQIPKTGTQGNAVFVDPTVVTAEAEDVRSGKYFIDANGDLVEGQSAGSGAVVIEDTTDIHGGTIRTITSSDEYYIQNSKTVTPTDSAQVVNPDTGYQAMKSVTVSAVPSGSATTPATTVSVTPSISVSSGGLITATASGTKSVTPTVSAGYVSSGTAGTITVSGSNTSQLTTLGATTYNTSSSDQTISSGRYLTGNQTIRGVTVSGLSAGNIASGVTVMVGDSADADRIASVTGTLAFVTYYTGSTTPSSSLGQNGDIYLKTS